MKFLMLGLIAMDWQAKEFVFGLLTYGDEYNYHSLLGVDYTDDKIKLDILYIDVIQLFKRS